MRHPIQKFIVPDPELSDCPELYFRGAPEITNGPTLRVAAGGKLSTDTFFNSLSLSPWVHATQLKRVAVQITLQGSGEIEICHLRKDRETVLQTAELQSGTWVSDAFEIGTLGGGLLYARVHAQTELQIQAIEFVTEDAPARSVQLGMVITTFNRQQQTLGAIRRLSRSLDELPPEERAQYKILVIDNGRNLDFQSTDLCEVIPNANLGGTGGFMKGLIELQDRGTFTHCLFMDDDASCFFESVARTKRFFEYASLPKLAVSGTMLLDKPSYMQYEFTAYFRRLCRPRLGHIDARNTSTLLTDDEFSGALVQGKPISSEVDVRYNYGGWWFFGFALADVRTYSFPFFVRGDDIYFSIHNELRVFGLSGVASWQESFQSKNSPFTRYLDCRSHIVQNLLLPGRSPFLKLIDCIWTTHYFATRFIQQDRKLYAQATHAALRDVLKGPEFWFSNLDFTQYLKALSARLKSQKNAPYVANSITTAYFLAKCAIELSKLMLLFPRLIANYNHSRLELRTNARWRKIFGRFEGT
jgi:GT2 family glycosyltransferase